MNDWDGIEASLRSDNTRRPGVIDQIWRSTALARTWLDAHEIDVRTVTAGDIARFIAEVEPTSGPRNPSQRKTFVNSVVVAALAISPPQERAGTLAGRLGDVGDKSQLGQAVARVLAGARSEGDRRRFATCLGAFLRWCDNRGIPPSECWPGDLTAYKRDRLTLGTGHTASTAAWRVASWTRLRRFDETPGAVTRASNRTGMTM